VDSLLTHAIRSLHMRIGASESLLYVPGVVRVGGPAVIENPLNRVSKHHGACVNLRGTSQFEGGTRRRPLLIPGDEIFVPARLTVKRGREVKLEVFLSIPDFVWRRCCEFSRDA